MRASSWKACTCRTSFRSGGGSPAVFTIGDTDGASVVLAPRMATRRGGVGTILQAKNDLLDVRQLDTGASNAAPPDAQFITAFDPAAGLSAARGQAQASPFRAPVLLPHLTASRGPSWRCTSWAAAAAAYRGRHRHPRCPPPRARPAEPPELAEAGCRVGCWVGCRGETSRSPRGRTWGRKRRAAAATTTTAATAAAAAAAGTERERRLLGGGEHGYRRGRGGRRERRGRR